MSSLVKLQIRGIRSFGTEEKDEAKINFSSPLTLIVGHNGCGKTTIIESLKYATCGEMPAGTDSGSGFVHDPKLSGSVESKASVKLRICDINGRNYTVFRALQVTQKLKRLEFKTKESVITDDSTKGGVSTRCSDVDSTMCNYLGVSKPILTNVIFCHQEDADWPLDKGKKMKDKFDAIFGITEYNKCLEHIRKLIKTNQENKKLLDNNFKNSSVWRNEANAKKRALDEHNAKLSATQDEINKWNEDMEVLQQELDELTRKEINIAVYVTDLRTREERLNVLNQGERDLRKEITEIFDGTKQDLQNAIENFGNDLRDRQKSLSKLEDDIRKVSNEEKKVQDLISNERQKLGKLQRDEEQNKERLLESNRIIEELTTELGVAAVSLKTDERTKSDVVDSMGEKIEEHRKELEQLQEDQENVEKSLQTKIDDCRERKISLDHDVKSKSAQLSSIKSELRKLKTDLSEIDKSTTTLANLSTRIDAINKELEETNRELNTTEIYQAINVNKSDRNRCEDQLAKLDKEIRLLSGLKADQSELQRLNDAKIDKENEIKRLIDKHTDSLIHLLKEVPEQNLKRSLQSSIDSLAKDIANKRTSMSQKQRELATLIADKKHLKEKLWNRQKTLSNDEDRIQELCRDQDFDKILEQINSSIDEKQYEKGTLTSSEFLYKRYITKLHSTDPLCPVCHRGFDEEVEISTLINDMNSKLVKLPNLLTEVKLELDSLLKKQSQLLQLKPTFENISHTRNTEIPSIKDEMAKIEKRLIELRSEIGEEENHLSILQTDESSAKSIQSDAVLIDEYRSEVQKLERSITEIQTKLKEYKLTRTSEEAQEEHDIVKAKWSRLNQLFESDHNKLSKHEKKMHELHAEKNSLTSKLMKIEGGVEKRTSMIDKLAELNNQENNLATEVEQTKGTLESVTAELNAIIKEQIRTKSRHKITLEEKKTEVAGYERRFDNVQNLLSIIANYERCGSMKLSDSRIILQQMESKKATLLEKRNSLQENLNETNQLISNHKLVKFNLDNNLKLITKVEEKRTLEDEIRELKGRSGNIDPHHISREKKIVSDKLDNLKRKHARTQGRKDVLQQRILESEIELQKDCYRDAEMNHRKNAAAVGLKKRVINDLNIYYCAMDWAMIHVHKERMQLINRIARDLWRRIYCGNDIDCIEIKMDETSKTGADKRRNYNYRVVQIKNGNEMDMPGRCSAGQKVLASLIIRIALAETFSRNCGIIALDEPTTNLDRENIESLSEALADIVTMRSVQKNFQLLVITHDEEFIDKLSRVDKVDRYLKVVRNERGLSRVLEVKL